MASLLNLLTERDLKRCWCGEQPKIKTVKHYCTAIPQMPPELYTAVVCPNCGTNIELLGVSPEKKRAVIQWWNELMENECATAVWKVSEIMKKEAADE